MTSGLKTLYGLQIISGVLSFIASTTMAIMILRSAPKLGTPFRRIIFGLSVSDMLQSISSVIGPIVTVPAPGNIKLWNIGNQKTCDFQGFIVTFGATMCCFYTLFLCMFFLHVVKYNKTNKEFSTTIERKMHGIAIAYSLCTSVTYLIFGFYNNVPHGNMCFVIDSPFGCHMDQNMECERGEYSANVLALTMIPCMFISVAMHYYLGSLYLFVKKDGERQRKRFTLSLRMNNQPNSRRSSLPDNERTQRTRDDEQIESLVSRIRRTNNRIPATNAPVYVTRAERRSRALSRQTLKQSSMYAGAYLIAYAPPLLTYFGWQRQGQYHPLAFAIVAHTIYPLQGLLTLLVYTRPKVLTVRQQNPDLSWHQAIWEVIKTGGDIPAKYQRSRRRTLGWQLGNDIPVEINRRR